MVNRVDVGHAVNHYTSDFFKPGVRAHHRDGIALDKDISLGEKLKGFEGGAIGAKDTLAALDEAVFITNEVPDLDYVTCYAVFEDFDGLRGGYGA